MEARFYTVNDRPIRILPTADGGLTAESFDLRTGAFVFDPAGFGRVSDHGKDIDAFDARAFDALVGELRVQIPIQWEGTGDGEHPYGVTVGAERWVVRVNDFPAEPLYTLMADGRELVHLDDWPAAWSRPR